MESINKDMRGFWDKRAATYPRYEENSIHETAMLKIIRELGVSFKDAEVLDVGCGSGKFTINIAKEASHVTGTDISGEMLKILNEDAKANGIGNITTLRTDFEDFSSDKKFDVTFCSMSPAVRSDKNRAKLNDLADKYVVYMGFLSKTDSGKMRELYEHFGVQRKEFNDAVKMKQWLDDKGVSYSSRQVRGEWSNARNREGMLGETLAMLSAHGEAIDRGYVERYIDNFLNADGQYVTETKYEIEVIVWQK